MQNVSKKFQIVNCNPTQLEPIAAWVWPIPRTRSLALSTESVGRVCIHQAIRTRISPHNQPERGGTTTAARARRGPRAARLYMWAKNDTLVEVTSCEVSPSADDCTGCSFAVVTPGNDVALAGVKVAARTIVVFALLYASGAPSDPVLWLCSRGSITRDGFRERPELCSVESIRVYRFLGDENLAGCRARSNSLASIYEPIFFRLCTLTLAYRGYTSDHMSLIGFG